MSKEKMICTADLIFTDAVQDYALRANLPVSEVRDQMIDSGAYDALYDFDTGL